MSGHTSTPARLLCIGDLHLGAHPQYADDRLGEQEAVWLRALELAYQEGCDAVLFAGDVFEGPQVTPEQMDAFIRPIEATRGEMPVIAISGNGKHDSAMRTVNALAPLRHVPGLHVHSRPTVLNLVDGAVLTDLSVPSDLFVCCMPWASTKWLRARGEKLGLDDVDTVNGYAANAALAVAKGLKDAADTRTPTVLLTHFSISGSSLPTGLPVDELREPVLDHYALSALGFDAIVAGHIHRSQLIDAGEPNQPFFYVGSPMPLDFGEANVEHGVWILDIAPEASSAQFVPLESRSFQTIDLEEAECWLDMPGPPAADRWRKSVDGALVKVRYTATREQAALIEENEIRRALLEAGAHRVTFDPIIERKTRARVEGLDETIGADQALDLWIESSDLDPALAEQVRERHLAYTAELEGAPA